MYLVEEAMIKNSRHYFVRLSLLATALPLGLLAADAMSAHAGTVTVTGANGAAGAQGKPGGAGAPAAATSTSSDSSNSAMATGGIGGAGGPGGSGVSYLPRPGAGGYGGAASSTATASNMTGSASATATSTGGNGGRGGLPIACIHSCIPGAGGGGGGASATSSATGGGAGTVTSDATASGGAGGVGLNRPPGGSASASASARNSAGTALATASAPAASSAKAVANATLTNTLLGAGSAPLLAINVGQAAADATLALEGQMIGIGAMSIGYGATSSAITYDATALFDFTARPGEALDLMLISDESAVSPAGIGFDNLNLQVVNATTATGLASLSFTSSSAAQTFFDGGQVSLGLAAAGPQSIEIEYSLTFAAGTSASPGDGFGFTYALKDPPLNVPEPSTWVMLIVAFVGLGVAGWRRGRGPDFPPRTGAISAADRRLCGRDKF